MTDNEIIKALECCRDNDNNLNMEKCFDVCPYDGECARKFMQDVLSLINRQKAEIKGLRDEVEHLHEGAACEADALYKATDIYNVIKSAPTADVVEVVRCKDCTIPHNRFTGCPKLNGLIPPENHFCSFGERKEGDTEWRQRTE